MLLWHLFEEDDGWCVVNQKNVVQAGPLKINDRCKFWYKGKEYEGKLLKSDECYETLNEELNRLFKECRSKSKQANKTSKPEKGLPQKRRISPPSFYGTKSSNSSSNGQPAKKTKLLKQPMTEAEKERQLILELNKNEAKNRSNGKLLDRLLIPQNDNDPDYHPPSEDSQDSDVDLTTNKLSVRSNRDSILKAIKNQGFNSDDISSPPPSPSREELKQQIAQLQAQLQSPPGRKSHNIASSSSAEDKEGNHKDKEHDIGDLMDDDTLDGFLNNKGDNNINEENDHGNDEGGEKKKKNGSPMKTKKKNGSPNKRGKGDDSSFDIHNNSEKDEELKSSERDTSRDNFSDDDILDLDKSIDSDLDYQLYGKRNNTTELGRKIYCKTDVLTKALTNANSVNTLVRRMLGGVYIPSKILNCTTTGQSWHAGGSDKSKEEMKPLHPGALKVIVAFANKVALSKKWKQKSFEKCKPVVSNRLVEIKKQVKEGKLSD